MVRSCTLKGKPLALQGPELKVGDAAPDVVLKSSLVEQVRIASTNGKVRIFSVVPSLDTPVCSQQTKRFNEEATKLKNVDFYTVSVDLPPAQARYCGAENINKDRLKFLSDYMDVGFGRSWGTLIPELRIECRAAFVLDPAGVIRYAEYVPEVANLPNFDAVLECARKVSG